MVMELTKNNKLLTRYPLASGVRRLFAKIIDLLIISAIVIGLGLSIFTTDPEFRWSENNNYFISQTWRYGIFTLLVAFSFYGLMILLPYYWKKTIGMKLIKLSYYKILPLSNTALCLIKHELFVWELFIFLDLILGIVLTILSPTDAYTLLRVVLLKEKNKDSLFYPGLILSSLYIFAFILLMFLIMGVFIKNKKPAYHDKYSNLYIIYLKPINDLDKLANKKKQSKKIINYSLPGSIKPSTIEEVDKL